MRERLQGALVPTLVQRHACVLKGEGDNSDNIQRMKTYLSTGPIFF